MASQSAGLAKPSSGGVAIGSTEQNPWCADSAYQSPVPCEVAGASLAKSVHGPVGQWRMNGYEDTNPVLGTLRAAVHEEVLTEAPADIFNSLMDYVGSDTRVDPRTPFVADYMAPVVGVLSTLWAMNRINRHYIRKLLEPGDGNFWSGAKFALFWLGAFTLAYTGAHNFSRIDEIFADGTFHPERLIVNRQLVQSMFFYWALTSSIWSNIGFISLRTSGPALKYLFLRGHTLRERFFNNGKLVGATVDALRDLFSDDKTKTCDRIKTGIPQASFRVEAEGLPLFQDSCRKKVII